MACPSSLSAHPSDDSSPEKHKTPLASNPLLLSSSFSSFVHQSPLLLSKPPNPKLNFHVPFAVAARVVRDLHISIVDGWVRLLYSFASHSPFLSNLFSLPSRFRNLSQIHQRNYRNLNSLSSNHNFAAILPGDSVAGVVVANGILNFLNIYNTLLVVRLVLTWFPNSPPAIVSPLSTLCDPYLNIFRGLIPPLGGTLDLSPILAFLVLNAFTSTAAALPAELPPTGISQELPTSCTTASNLSTSQQKWIRRHYGSRRRIGDN
ncbi:ylmG homolog protein 2, chloroplastic [Actinidia eriantha]|uniref:ylmG homolog protein 2, chloroplastic n=1 Tax=Actinidia eriantha TaxID=165200 RepID=UPI0025887EE1|nr:ylmG homolog protein 2, chloroplastic [Actinidia eriantha]